MRFDELMYAIHCYVAGSDDPEVAVDEVLSYMIGVRHSVVDNNKPRVKG